MTNSLLVRMSRVMRLRKHLGRPFLRLNESVWKRLPSALKEKYPISAYGVFLQSLVKLRSSRTQLHGTFFLRNRPQLDVIRSLVAAKPRNGTAKILVLACSNGAEVYSIAWTIRCARPDLRLTISAIDISPDILEIASKAVYSLGANKLVNAPIFERLTAEEVTTMFDKDGDNVTVKSWIRDGIEWQVADANDRECLKRLGGQDLVVANNFLCHMAPREAERCLRNVADFVGEDGYLVVSGVDLDIRTRVALELNWTPVEQSLEQIHDGDPSVRRDWPWRYWGLEPLEKRRKDWRVRYASIFRCAGNRSERLSSQEDARRFSGQTLVKTL